jgi:cell growth-regulating nucleolar protein
MVHFEGLSYRAHTSCISEAQKYQGSLYREKDNKKANKGAKRKSSMPGGFPDNNEQAMVPHKHAYVEDAPEGDDMNTVAVIDVPPKAPTPPVAPESPPPNVNVFDFLVQDAPTGAERKELEAPNGNRMIDDGRYTAMADSQYSQYSNGDGSQYLHYGYSYGNAPVQPTFERYNSSHNLMDSQPSHTNMPPPYVTPGPKEHKKEKHKSDKKRKRAEELDLSSAKRPTSRGDEMMIDAPSTVNTGRVLHSGLTGGLTRLVTDPSFYDDRIDAGPTPISPLKRSKRGDKERDTSKDERRKSSYTSFTTTTSKPSSSKHGDDRNGNHRSRSKDRESQASSKHHRHHTKSHRRGSSSSPDGSRRSGRKAIDYPDRPASVQPTASNKIAKVDNTRAELFLSFVKGPESERGCSINKALKRYHRERASRGEGEEDEDDKELWKSLRLRKNERGEIVVFVEGM